MLPLAGARSSSHSEEAQDRPDDATAACLGLPSLGAAALLSFRDLAHVSPEPLLGHLAQGTAVLWLPVAAHLLLLPLPLPVSRSKKSGARVGRIHTPHGIVDTPGFVAVGTNAALKAVDGPWADAGATSAAIGPFVASTAQAPRALLRSPAWLLLPAS